MSRGQSVASHNDAESALSDDDLDGVVGGGIPLTHAHCTTERSSHTRFMREREYF
jgi:hypothetical protein